MFSNREEAFEFNKKALFIGGPAKSGTTLLMSLLDNHPQLVVLPEETGYLEHRKRIRELKDCNARLEYLLTKTGLKGLGEGKVDVKNTGSSADARDYQQFDHQYFLSLVREFVDRPWMNDSLLFSEMVRAYGIAQGADWRNCVRWVEKTPRSESYLKEMDALFPGAKMIMMIRDPRAVFASFKNRIINQYGAHAKAHRLPRSWNRSARQIPRLRRDRSRFLVIRYEDLIQNPRETLENICRFGGFDFSKNMLEPTRAGGGWEGNSAFHGTFKGISSASLDLWKDRLSEDEIWWIEQHCRKGMEMANYPLLTNAHFSFSRWLKRLPGESWHGYFRARRASLCQGLGLLKECQYNLDEGAV